MGPTNAIIGDNYGTDLPETTVSNEAEQSLKNAARFSKSKEFQELKRHLESRMAFYQTYLPDGRHLEAVDTPERGQMWVAANYIIAECRAIIDVYEQAAEALKKKAS
jgi:hypothetical protein